MEVSVKEEDMPLRKSRSPLGRAARGVSHGRRPLLGVQVIPRGLGSPRGIACELEEGKKHNLELQKLCKKFEERVESMQGKVEQDKIQMKTVATDLGIRIEKLEAAMRAISGERSHIEDRVTKVIDQKMSARLESSNATTGASIQAIQAQFGLLHVQCEQVQARAETSAGDVTASLELTDKLVTEQVRYLSDEIERQSKKCDASLESMAKQIQASASEAKENDQHVKQQVETLVAETMCQMKKHEETCSALETSLQTIREERDLMESKVVNVAEQMLVTRLHSAAATTEAQLQAIRAEFGLLSTKCEQQRQGIDNRIDAFAKDSLTRAELAERSLEEKMRCVVQEIEGRFFDGMYDKNLESMKRQVTAATVEAQQQHEKMKTRIDAVENVLSRRMESLREELNPIERRIAEATELKLMTKLEPLGAVHVQCKLLETKVADMQASAEVLASGISAKLELTEKSLKEQVCYLSDEMERQSKKCDESLESLTKQISVSSLDAKQQVEFLSTDTQRRLKQQDKTCSELERCMQTIHQECTLIEGRVATVTEQRMMTRLDSAIAKVTAELQTMQAECRLLHKKCSDTRLFFDDENERQSKKHDDMLQSLRQDFCANALEAKRQEEHVRQQVESLSASLGAVKTDCALLHSKFSDAQANAEVIANGVSASNTEILESLKTQISANAFEAREQDEKVRKQLESHAAETWQQLKKRDAEVVALQTRIEALSEEFSHIESAAAATNVSLKALQTDCRLLDAKCADVQASAEVLASGISANLELTNKTVKDHVAYLSDEMERQSKKCDENLEFLTKQMAGSAFEAKEAGKLLKQQVEALGVETEHRLKKHDEAYSALETCLHTMSKECDLIEGRVAKVIEQRIITHLESAEASTNTVLQTIQAECKLLHRRCEDSRLGAEALLNDVSSKIDVTDKSVREHVQHLSDKVERQSKKCDESVESLKRQMSVNALEAGQQDSDVMKQVKSLNALMETINTDFRLLHAKCLETEASAEILANGISAKLELSDKNVKEHVQFLTGEIERQSKKCNENLESLATETKSQWKKYDAANMTLERSVESLREECSHIEEHVTKATDEKLLARLESSAATTSASLQAIQADCRLLQSRCEEAEHQTENVTQQVGSLSKSLEAIKADSKLLHATHLEMQTSAAVLANSISAKLELSEKSTRERVHCLSDQIERQSRTCDESLVSLKREMCANAIEVKHQDAHVLQQVESLNASLETIKADCKLLHANHVDKQTSTEALVKSLSAKLEFSEKSAKEREHSLIDEIKHQTKKCDGNLESLKSDMCANALQTKQQDAYVMQQVESLNSSLERVNADCKLLHANHAEMQSISGKLELTDKSIREQVSHLTAEIEHQSKKCDDSLAAFKQQLSASASEAKQQYALLHTQCEQQQRCIDANREIKMRDDQVRARIDAVEKSLQRRGEAWALEKQETNFSIAEHAETTEKKLVQFERDFNAALQQQLHDTKSLTEKRLSDMDSNVASIQQSIHGVHSGFGQELSKFQSALVRATQSQMDLKTTSEEAIADVRSKLGTLSRSLDSKVSEQQLCSSMNGIEEEIRMVYGSLDKKASKQHLDVAVTGMQELQCLVAEGESESKKRDESLESMKGQIALVASEVQQQYEQAKQKMLSLIDDAKGQVKIHDDQVQARLDAVEKSLNRRDEALNVERQEAKRSLTEQVRTMEKKVVQIEQDCQAALQRQFHDAKSYTEKRLSEMDGVYGGFGQELSKFQSSLIKATQSQLELKTTSEDAIADLVSQLGALRRSVDSKVSDQRLDSAINGMETQLQAVHNLLDKKAAKQQLDKTITGVQAELMESLNVVNTEVAKLKAGMASAQDQINAIQTDKMEKEELIKTMERLRQGAGEKDSKVAEMKDAQSRTEQQLKTIVDTVNEQLSTVHHLIGQTVSKTSFVSAATKIQDQLADMQRSLGKAASHHQIEQVHAFMEQKAAESRRILELMEQKAAERRRILEQTVENRLEHLSKQVECSGVVLNNKASKQEVVDMIDAIYEKLAPIGTALDEMASKRQLEEMVAGCQEQLVGFDKVLGTKVSDCDIVGRWSMLDDNIFNMQASVIAVEKNQKFLEEQFARGLALVRRYEPVERALKDIHERMLGVQQQLLPVDQIVKRQDDIQQQLLKITTLERAWNDIASTMSDLKQKASHEDVSAKVESLRSQVEEALEAAILEIQQGAEAVQADLQGKLAELKSLQESQDSRFAPLESLVMSATEQATALSGELAQKASREELTEGIGAFGKQFTSAVEGALQGAQKQVEAALESTHERIAHVESAKSATIQDASQLVSGISDLQTKVSELEHAMQQRVSMLDSALGDNKARIDEVDGAVRVLETLRAEALGMR